jgi:hypothetical protein
MPAGRADLDYGQIDDALTPVRSRSSDPYGLDRECDGLGCEVGGQGGRARPPWGLFLRNPGTNAAVR